MYYKLLSILFVSLLVPYSLLAHDEKPENPESWKGGISFGFNLTDGNSDVTLLNFGAKASREKDKNIWNFEGNYSYGEDDNEVNVDTSEVIGEYKRLLNERWFAALGVNYSRDEIADVKYRVKTNPALGYFILKSNEHKLSLEAGPSYIFEEVGDIEDDYAAYRLAKRYDWQITKISKFYDKLEGTVSVDDSENYLINAEVGIEAAIVDALALVLKVVVDYDNEPAAGSERTDIGTFTSVAYKFG